MSKLAKALTAAAGNAGGESLYVEDVFSTYLYTGTGATQTITNGIDLDGEGGIVWLKNRTSSADHRLVSPEISPTGSSDYYLIPNSTAGRAGASDMITSFNSDGFSLNYGYLQSNQSGQNYASWAFRKAEKFFDVVTYTGDGTTTRTLTHSLNAEVGMMIVKSVSSSGEWWVYHKSLDVNPETKAMQLSETYAAFNAGNVFGGIKPTSTEFSVGSGSNYSGQNYIVYLFAHDAGGFGDDGDESIIKCGSYTGNGSTTGPTVTLGWEPQWLLVRAATTTQDWYIIDTMRGMTNGTSATALLQPNTSNSENLGAGALMQPTATGFNPTSASGRVNSSGQTYIYIAIRRPMKTPESGTEVFSPTAFTGNGTYPRTVGTLNASDFTIVRDRTGAYWHIADRLRGGAVRLWPNTTDAETAWTNSVFGQNGFTIGSTTNDNTVAYINYAFRRATGFFDVVAYTGTGSATTQAHNLGVAPELMIVKTRSTTGNWAVYNAISGAHRWIKLNNTDGLQTEATPSIWNDTEPTASVFSLCASDASDASAVNENGTTYIAYLFATVAGVSKVGSYTGTGADLNVDCGFSAGARFILIKRTNSTGAWYVWDSARGIVAGNDPYLLLNSTAAEVTGTDYIDPLSSGFTITSSAPAALNASGGNYIFLAIA